MNMQATFRLFALLVLLCVERVIGLPFITIFLFWRWLEHEVWWLSLLATSLLALFIASLYTVSVTAVLITLIVVRTWIFHPLIRRTPFILVVGLLILILVTMRLMGLHIDLRVISYGVLQGLLIFFSQYRTMIGSLFRRLLSK